jgi:7 transmembrane helices usually fused to an inactive transglutaminase/Transglutaminase-like superfamily
MSKTGLSVITALVLAALAVALHLARRAVFGSEPIGPQGIATWRVTMAATGELASSESSLTTPRPPDFRRQHVFDEKAQSKELLPPRGKKTPQRRDVVWRRSSLGQPQPFRLTYSFNCVLGIIRPTSAMIRLSHEIDAPPLGTACLRPTHGVESTSKEIADKAAELVERGMTTEEQVHAVYDYVNELENEPSVTPRTALECLRDASGDSEAKSRLLVALCRSRDIPARLACGLVLTGNQEQPLHYWAEAWAGGRWLPMCPTYHHFGPRGFPSNYLVLHVGEDDFARGRGARLRYGFVVQELADPLGGDERPASWWRTLWQKASLYTLGPGERHVIRFLLLLPLSALIVSVFRTLIGVPTFGTFSPALVGLAFLDLKALPWGLSIFVTTVLVGWILRRLIDRYHLLLVPRTSVLLTLIVVFLMFVILIASHYGVATTQYISLFPLVILTHLVERFWTVETEDGTAASFKTLAGTLVVAVFVSVLLSPEPVTAWMFRYPETLGVVLAAQFLIGRYTGYRLSELYRFRDLLDDQPSGGSGA